MQKEKSSDSRFQNFEQVFNRQGHAIGFSLPNNDYIFMYTSQGGWYDQKGTYYNKSGVIEQRDRNLEGQKEGHSEESNEESDERSDDEVLDELQQMLADEEEGIIRKKKREQHKMEEIPQQKGEEQEQQGSQNHTKEIPKLIQNYKQGKEVRSGLPKELFIYFRLKNDQCIQVVPQVQKQTTVLNQNAKVKQIKVEIENNKKQIIQNNKNWLTGDHIHLDFSGASFEEGIYERYWHGIIKASADNFQQLWEEIDKSKEFKLLDHKTFHALKSKFYLKKQMQKVIQDLKKKIEPLKDTESIQIQLNNLHEDFSVSFVFQLLQFSGANLQDIIQVKIKDEYAAIITCTKPAALLIANLEGYCHDRGQYIWLEVKPTKKEILERKKWFKIKLDSQFKINYVQLFDTMALQQSKTEVVKHYTKEDQYRWSVHHDVLNRVVRFRGPTVNISAVKQHCTEKDLQ